jgi:hypothetical protein
MKQWNFRLYIKIILSGLFIVMDSKEEKRILLRIVVIASAKLSWPILKPLWIKKC